MTINGTVEKNGYSFYAVVTETIPEDYIATNQTILNYAVYLQNGNKRTNSSRWTFNGKIDGSNVYHQTNQTLDTTDVDYHQSHLVFNGSQRIKHNNDGTKTITFSSYLSKDGYSSLDPGYCSLSGPITLTTIPRKANVTSASDFNDESNPTIKYTNPAGFRINARLEFGNTSISRNNISNTGTYTFDLTTSERNLLRQKCTGKTMVVREVIATCMNGTTETDWSYLDKTMSIVNGNPTFDVSYEDNNSTTLGITNNNQQIIQNNSNLQFNITNATALKYASLSSVKITINGVTKTETISGSSLTFIYGLLNISNNINANVVLVDSRGFETAKSVSLSILSWSLPSAIIDMLRKGNYYTETDIKVDASYSSLDNKNTIDIKYRYKKKISSTWSSYSTLQDNVISTFNADNEYEWDVQVVLQDRIGTTTFNLSLGIGLPILFIDRLLRSIGINCFPKKENSLEIDGKTIFDLIYPIGSLYLSVNNTNPATIFGGTWEEFGKGRALVGVDINQPEFATVEATGGNKNLQQHNHTMTSAGAHTHKADGSNMAVAQWGWRTNITGFRVGDNIDGYVLTSMSEAGAHSHEINNTGTGDSGNLQPYITCYIWKRTA